MKNYKALLFLFVLTLIMAGCKKDDDDDAAPTKEQLITAKDWRLTAARVVGTAVTIPVDADAFPYLEACLKDNIFKFSTGGKFTIDEGADKCPSAPQTQEGNWSISGDKVTIGGTALTSLGLPSSAAQDFTITELTNETLKLTLSESITITLPSVPLPVTASNITLTFTGQ